MAGTSTSGRAQPDPYAVFRPRRGRRVALTMSGLSVVIFTGVALAMPWMDPQVGGWTVPDRALMVLCGLVFGAGLWRFASIRAIPSKQGLVIRNLFTTRTVEWAQILRVQFGGGAPWVSVDLDDTDTVAVMAIQKSDGVFGQAEASRLSALAQVHGGPRHTG
jgi:Bacterial PH domain